MSKYYLDVEVIVTKRIYLSDNCDVEAIKEKLDNNDYDITEEEGFLECEYLPETEMLHTQFDMLAEKEQPVLIKLNNGKENIYYNSVL